MERPDASNQVMINGPAVRRMEEMESRISRSLRDVEHRINLNINEKFKAHEKVHSIYEDRSKDRHDIINRRLRNLEQDDIDDDILAAHEQGRKQGRVDFIFWFRDNRTWLWPLIGVLIGWLIGLSDGINIHI